MEVELAAKVVVVRALGLTEFCLIPIDFMAVFADSWTYVVVPAWSSKPMT